MLVKRLMHALLLNMIVVVSAHCQSFGWQQYISYAAGTLVVGALGGGLVEYYATSADFGPKPGRPFESEQPAYTLGESKLRLVYGAWRGFGLAAIATGITMVLEIPLQSKLDAWWKKLLVATAASLTTSGILFVALDKERKENCCADLAVGAGAGLVVSLVGTGAVGLCNIAMKK